jgi:hypothetical protein
MILGENEVCQFFREMHTSYVCIELLFFTP